MATWRLLPAVCLCVFLTACGSKSTDSGSSTSNPPDKTGGGKDKPKQDPKGNPGGGKKTPAELLVGKWEHTDKDGMKDVLEFSKDGTVKMLDDQAKYRLVGDTKVVVEFADREDPKKTITQELTVQITADELSVTEMGLTTKYKRVK